MPSKVVIADDRPRSRSGLRAVLALWPEIQVIGEAADGQEAVRLLEQLRPDVVLMDASMPGMDGLEATRHIKATWPQVKVIVLTIHPRFQAGALAAGADAFLLKGCPPQELLQAIVGQGKKSGS
jgi:DNA-binding NarL/FixJ family response regulator